MLCFECGEGRLKRKTTQIHEEFRGEKVTVEMEALVCGKCGYQTIPADRAGEFGRLLVEAYREKRNLLRGQEIRRRRESLGMSQEAFAKWVKVGTASVKRWELGALQDEAMDELIRLKTDPEYAKSNYEAVCRKAGVEAEQARVVVVPFPAQRAYNFVVPARGGAWRVSLERGGAEAAARLASIQMV